MTVSKVVPRDFCIRCGGPKPIERRHTYCLNCCRHYMQERARQLRSFKIYVPARPYKRCIRCRTRKALSAFHKSAQTYDLLSVYCKTCTSAIGKKWYRKNKDQHYQLTRRWDKNHPGRSKEIRRKAKSSPVYQQKLRARRVHLRSIESFTKEEWQNLCSEYQGRCAACHQKCKQTVDHVIPLSLGGSNTIDNIQPLCGSCNSSKNNKIKDYRHAGKSVAC